MNVGDPGVTRLAPKPSVALLLCHVENWTQLQVRQPDEITAAVARLNQKASEIITAFSGVRLAQHGEGDSFAAAFAHSCNAAACSVELQRARLAPIQLRTAVYVGGVKLPHTDPAALSQLSHD